MKAERRLQMEYKRFEWGHPDELIQSDLTSFNGFPILTLEDDHSRKGWALRLEDAKDDRVVYGMEELHPEVYENLLTDNGRQFARNNSTMRKYCESYLTGKHIWSVLLGGRHISLGSPLDLAPSIARSLQYSSSLSHQKTLK